MINERRSRRDFLRNLACIAASGSAAAMLPQLRMMGTALASTSTLTGYRALVCVNLGGGNDSWNMLVPNDTARFNIYSASRGGIYSAANLGGLGLAQPTGGQIPVQEITDGNDGSSATNRYFIHPSLAEVGTLYRSGTLGFITNVGTLVWPISKADFNASIANRPAQLFSHSDQSDQWSQGSTRSSTQGWGGLLGDIVRPSNANQQLSPCISIAGSSRFVTGLTTSAYQLGAQGLQPLFGACDVSQCYPSNNARDVAINQLLSETYANDFAAEYASTFKRGRDLYSLLGTDLPTTTLSTTFPTTNIASQLQLVAKMIKLCRANNYAARQIYFVSMGGYDMHDNLMGSSSYAHAALLTQLSQAMGAFQIAMGPGDVNVANEVTTFTSSEFGRTLSSNGDGSDHAWGGVQMVMGGAVQGGKLYSSGGGVFNGFPDQSLDSGASFARGQMIPGIGVEQFGATLARWMGITSSELASIFPNIGNFGSTNLGFL